MSPVSHRKQAMSSASDYNFSTTSSQVKDCRSIDEPGYAVLGAGIAAAQDGGCGGGTADPGVRSNKRRSGPGGIQAAAKAGAAGILTLEDALLVSTRRQMAERAITTRLPIVYGSREFAEAGGLISYGVDRRHMYRRTAEYVDMILKGAHPAELPVEQPTKFELVINLQAAKAIGLAVPDQLLALADDVIE